MSSPSRAHLRVGTNPLTSIDADEYERKIAAEKEKEEKWFSIEDVTFGKGVVAAKDIPPGTIVYSFPSGKGGIVDKPSMYTIQVDDGMHLDITGGPEYTNHSCEANCYFRFTPSTDKKNYGLDLIAMRFVAKGQLLTFNYNTTEWDMSSPFTCCCGTKSCGKTIRGYKYLDDRERRAIDPLVSPCLHALAAREGRATASSSSQ